MRSTVSFFCALSMLAGSASASTIGVTLVSDVSYCRQGFNDNVAADSVCSSNGSGTVDDWGAQWSTAGGTSANLVGVGSTARTFAIDAAVAADDGGADIGQGGDRWIRANLNFNIQLTIDVDNPYQQWNVNLVQSALGLYAMRGDGSATAVGTQNAGIGRANSPFSVTVNGNPYNLTVAAASYSANPSNNGTASQQFSGSRSDNGILSGTGDGIYNVSISFSLEALSRDGCSGFICSSASGGVEAATLFGFNDVTDQAVDNYSTWSRSQTPDGYNSTWTLNVLNVPEPVTAGFLALGLTGLAAIGRRHSA